MATSSLPAASVPASAESLVDAAGAPIITWQEGRQVAADADGDADLLLGQLLAAAGAGAIVVVTPGTDDTGLHPRVDRIVGSRTAGYVHYPESFGPVITGKAPTALGLPFLAPTYAQSRAVAEQNNRAVMNALRGYDGTVIYTGYSQGAEAVGNAAEQQVRDDAGKDDADKVLGGNSLILLVSDPRGPWGIKSWAGDLPLSQLWATPVLNLIGIDNDGARDPADTGEMQVVSVIVQGDPVADWQWTWYRPGSSLLVNLAGFIAIHSPGDGPYGHLDGSANADGRVLVLGDPQLLRSADGNTSYAVYHTYHPLALLNAMVYDAVGLDYDESDLQRWDSQAQVFYPMTDVADRPGYGGVTVEAGGASQPAGTAGTADEQSSGATGSPGAAAQTDAGSPGGKHRLLNDAGQWSEPSQEPSGTAPQHLRGDGGGHESSPAPVEQPAAPTGEPTGPDSAAVEGAVADSAPILDPPAPESPALDSPAGGAPESPSTS